MQFYIDVGDRYFLLISLINISLNYWTTGNPAFWLAMLEDY